MCSVRSTAIERPGVSGMPCAPIGSSSRADRFRGRRHRTCSSAAAPCHRLGLRSIHSRMRCIDISSLGMMLRSIRQRPTASYGMAVGGIIVQAHQLAVVEQHPHRTLDLSEERIDRVLQPADFQIAPGQRAVVDRRCSRRRVRACAGGPCRPFFLSSAAAGAPATAIRPPGNRTRRLAIERIVVAVALAARRPRRSARNSR